jgi:hypothetical protein
MCLTFRQRRLGSDSRAATRRKDHAARSKTSPAVGHHPDGTSPLTRPGTVVRRCSHAMVRGARSRSFKLTAMPSWLSPAGTPVICHMPSFAAPHLLRTDHHQSGSPDGSRPGLYVICLLVETMHGPVTAESRPGHVYDRHIGSPASFGPALASWRSIPIVLASSAGHARARCSAHLRLSEEESSSVLP